MQRFAEDRLDEWLADAYRKPLVIRGARQVGKSTLVRQFAERRGLRLHEVNLERRVALHTVFETLEPDAILREVQFICGAGPIVGEGDLLFLDEIQAVPVAIQALRYLYEDRPELPVIAAGSLLEFALSKHSFSMPVGRIEYLFLGPVTFEEALQALGEIDLLTLLRGHRVGDSFPLSAHERLLDLQRIYLLVGGMPEAMQRYVETRDPSGTSGVHASITETYRDDFAKYASQSDLLRLHKVFDFVPTAVGEKLKYSRIDPHEQARDLRKAVDLLAKAQVITKAHHTDASGLPLRATINTRVLKPFFMDCGLMNAMCGIQGISLDELRSRSFINEGKMAEQFIAQHLAFLGHPRTAPGLTYWLREGRSANAEVDFVTQLGQSIVPVEVKAGKSGTLRSLHQFVCEKGVPAAVRFDLNPPSLQHVSHSVRRGKDTVEVELNLLSLPLYMVEQLPRLYVDAFQGNGA